jgi:outer membrane protein assembly factor BamB
VLVALAAGAVHAVESAGRAQDDASANAKRILDESGIKGGLIIHVPCGDGALCAALGENERLLVQGLDRDPRKVEAARRRVREAGCDERVSFDLLEGDQLPYVDDLVNLVVVSDPGAGILEQEVLRVLAPGGAAMIGGKRIVKPRPAEIDDWTHWLHGPDGNAVARDKRVGVSRSLQWIMPPKWSQHHNLLPSFSAMVCGEGRIYFIINEAPIAVMGLPDKWALVARDAFNGLLLWRKPIADWGWKRWVATQFGGMHRFVGPDQILMRRLVADGRNVYATLGYEAPVTALDGATGEVVREYRGTERTSEILLKNGRLILARHTDDEARAVNVLAVDAKSGAILWERAGFAGTGADPRRGNAKTLQTTAVQTYMACGEKGVFLVDGEHVVALDADTGRDLWRAPRPWKARSCTLVCAENAVFLAELSDRAGWPLYKNGHKGGKDAYVEVVVLALDAATGRPLWQRAGASPTIAPSPDLFVARGLVWVMNEDFMQQGLDPRTGEVRKEHSVFSTTAHHHRCYRNKATERFFFGGRHGFEIFDLESGEMTIHYWLRGACRYGVMPANGLMYVPAHSCGCWANVKLNGFLALNSRKVPDYPDTEPRLESGPAREAAQMAPAGEEDWPLYRHDERRSNLASTRTPESLGLRWRAMPGGALSAPIVARGKLFVGSPRSGAVTCLDADRGDVRWRFTADGAVDTPPAYHNGRVIFGSRGGSVYCLNAESGELGWRLHAAPKHLRLTADGQLESPWPLNGAVLVKDDKVYCVAGRSMHLDSGLFVYELEAATGRPLRRMRLQADTKMGQGELAGARLPDVLVSSGTAITMRGAALSFNAKEPYRLRLAASETFAAADGGLLDGTWYSGAFWNYGNTHGQVLTFDGDTVFGVRAFRAFGTYSFGQPAHTAGEGNKLFAADAKTKKRMDDKWCVTIPVRARSLVVTGEHVLLAGAPETPNERDPLAAFENRGPAVFAMHRRTDGAEIASLPLEAPPIHDGMAVAGGKVYLVLENGTVVCLAGR